MGIHWGTDRTFGCGEQMGYSRRIGVRNMGRVGNFKSNTLKIRGVSPYDDTAKAAKKEALVIGARHSRPANLFARHRKHLALQLSDLARSAWPLTAEESVTRSGQ